MTKITKNPHKHLRKLGDYVGSLEARVEELETVNKDLHNRLGCSILKYIDDACERMKNKCPEINHPDPLKWYSVDDGLKKGEVYRELLVRDSEGGITIGKVEYSEVSEGGGNWFCVLDDGEEHWDNITHFVTPSQYTSLHTTTNGAKDAEWIEVGELDEDKKFNYKGFARLSNGELKMGIIEYCGNDWEIWFVDDEDLDGDCVKGITHILPLTHFPIQKMVDDLNAKLNNQQKESE